MFPVHYTHFIPILILPILLAILLLPYSFLCSALFVDAFYWFTANIQPAFLSLLFEPPSNWPRKHALRLPLSISHFFFLCPSLSIYILQHSSNGMSIATFVPCLMFIYLVHWCSLEFMSLHKHVLNINLSMQNEIVWNCATFALLTKHKSHFWYIHRFGCGKCFILLHAKNAKL